MSSEELMKLAMRLDQLSGLSRLEKMDFAADVAANGAKEIRNLHSEVEALRIENKELKDWLEAYKIDARNRKLRQLADSV